MLCELGFYHFNGRMQDTLAEVFMAPWLGFDSFFH